MTAESGVSRGRCVRVIPRALVKNVWELPSEAADDTITLSCLTLSLSSKVLRAEVNCISSTSRRSQSVELGMVPLIRQRVKQLGAVL